MSLISFKNWKQTTEIHLRENCLPAQTQNELANVSWSIPRLFLTTKKTSAWLSTVNFSLFPIRLLYKGLLIRHEPRVSVWSKRDALDGLLFTWFYHILNGLCPCPAKNLLNGACPSNFRFSRWMPSLLFIFRLALIDRRGFSVNRFIFIIFSFSFQKHILTLKMEENRGWWKTRRGLSYKIALVPISLFINNKQTDASS